MAAFAPAPKGGGGVAVKKTSLHPPSRCSGKCNHMPFWFPFLPSHCHQSTKGGNKLFGFPFPSPGSRRSPSRFVFTVPTRNLNLKICAGKSGDSFLFGGLGEERGTESKSYA